MGRMTTTAAPPATAVSFDTASKSYGDVRAADALTAVLMGDSERIAKQRENGWVGRL